MDASRKSFLASLWHYYDAHGRHDLPWRIPEANGTFDPYKIVVSELMLQQTQVSRVLPKFEECMARFPKVADLADASLDEVLRLWSGLGYNRRAKFLWQTSQKIMQDFDGEFPQTYEALQTLPGVGYNTAGAILAYAYNQPVVFIETNVRTVYIHHFFQDQVGVADKDIARLIANTFDDSQPRIFYWALMDYGSYLKKSVGNVARAAKGYHTQSPFHGSRRQIRGQAIQALVVGQLTSKQLAAAIGDARLPQVLSELEAEYLIEQVDNHYRLLVR